MKNFSLEFIGRYTMKTVCDITNDKHRIYMYDHMGICGKGSYNFFKSLEIFALRSFKVFVCQMNMPHRNCICPIVEMTRS